MNRTIVARVLRALLVACGVVVVLVLVVDGGGVVFAGPLAVLLPFVAVAVVAVGLGLVLPRVDRLVERLTQHRVVTPYSALAAVAARIRAGSLEQALPGLARVLADGTGASRAVVWLAVGDHLLGAAEYPPPASGAAPQTVANLAVLLARPDTDHVVPVLDGTVLRAALAIGKPGGPITAGDQRLVEDVANGAALLLRGVALNAELAERVRRADDLATELRTSRERLANAREVERRRLVIELGFATGDRLAALRADVTDARRALQAGSDDAESAQEALARARVELDELLDRFRVIARGVYPAVLRDQGPAAALDEVAADLPRPVQLRGGLDGRLDYEIESGLYYVVAAAMAALAGRPAEGRLLVHFERTDGRARVRVEDPGPTCGVEDLRASLADEAERLAALGGDLGVAGPEEGAAGPLRVHASLPDRLEPIVQSNPGPAAGPAARAGVRVPERRTQRVRTSDSPASPASPTYRHGESDIPTRRVRQTDTATPANRHGERVVPATRPTIDPRLVFVGYAVLLAACTLLTFGWLAVGAVVAVAAHVPTVAGSLEVAAAGGDRLARAVLDGAPASEPATQAVLDYGFSLVSIAIAVALLFTAGRSWSIRLLVLAMIGSAGAFNLQAHAADTAAETATGLPIGGLHQVLLHGVACAAYILALLVFPPDRPARSATLGRTVLIMAGSGTVLLVGFGTALLPHTTSCVVFFGFLVPLAGLAVLPRQIRRGPTAAARTQSRLLFSVLVAGFAIAVVLALVTLLLWSVSWTSPLVLVDPTAHPGGTGAGQPVALLFWFSRLACVAVAAAAGVAVTGGGLWTAERLFSKGLAAALVAALVGGGYVLARVLIESVVGEDTPEGAFVAAAMATAAAALVFLPVYIRTERVVDRLLYGSRPTPYSVLAEVAARSRDTVADAPDLARLAEAVGRGLGATTCRLTVLRPGLRDRAYTWADPGADPADVLVEVPVRHGAERIGTLAVDHAAVAGLHPGRQHLLEDIADSLGVVLQASRVGIELERQLRAALAHANEIAGSRRAAVAEMDRERRRIERDLHDGAQHQLVSLRLTLGLVEHQVSTAQFAQARERLAQIADQIDTVESVLAETAAGVSSPMLAELGLVRALANELGGGHPPVEFHADDAVAGQTLPSDVEAAVFFCCLEAVNNARKHALGAAVEVRLAIDDGRLRFTVSDDGPGWDPSAVSAKPGRGVRNVTSRITTVGGRVEIRSSPGAGTTVDGSAPIPEAQLPEAPIPEAQLPEGPILEPGAPPLAGSRPVPLAARVREAMRAGRDSYHDTPHAPALHALAERLDEPMQVAVAGVGASGLVEVLDADRPAGVRFTADVGADGPVADGFVLLLRHGDAEDAAASLPDGHRPAHAIGVLVPAADTPADGPLESLDEAASAWASRPDIRRLCHTVVPVDPRLALAVAPRGEMYEALQRWVESADAAPVPVAATAGRAGGAAPDNRAEPAAVKADPRADPRADPSADVNDAILQQSGLPRLRELVDTRFARRAEIWTARSALLELERLVRTAPPPSGARTLLYVLDRIRSAAPELAEFDLLDALFAGEHELSDEDARRAARLLGADGDAPGRRLGLGGDAGPQDVAAAAARELAFWRQRALQPASDHGIRIVTELLVRTCEQMLARGTA